MNLKYEDDYFYYILSSCEFSSNEDESLENFNEQCEISSYHEDCILYRKQKSVKEESKKETKFKISSSPSNVEYDYRDGFSPYSKKYSGIRNEIVKRYIKNFAISKINQGEIEKLKTFFQALSFFDTFIFLMKPETELNKNHYLACIGLAQKLFYSSLLKVFSEFSCDRMKLIKSLEIEIMNTIKHDINLSTAISFLKNDDFLKPNMIKYLEIIYSTYEFNHFSFQTQAEACLSLVNKNEHEIDLQTRKCASLIDLIFNKKEPCFEGLTPENKKRERYFKETSLKKKTILSKGAYGLVSSTEDSEAVKTISHDGNGICYSAVKEISLLSRLNHPNIISYKNIVITEDETCIYMELLPYNLRQFYQSNKCTFNFWKRCFKKILQGVEYLHSMNIIHADIKPENILISSRSSESPSDEGEDMNPIVKLIDLGISTLCFNSVANRNNQELCTVWYRAPELCMEHSTFTDKVDIWSVGCIFVEMLKKKPLFSKPFNVSVLLDIFQKLGTPDNIYVDFLCSNEQDWIPKFKKNKIKVDFDFENETNETNETNFHDLLSKMLEIDSRKRISALEALRHPLFDDLIL